MVFRGLHKKRKTRSARQHNNTSLLRRFFCSFTQNLHSLNSNSDLSSSSAQKIMAKTPRTGVRARLRGVRKPTAYCVGTSGHVCSMPQTSSAALFLLIEASMYDTSLSRIAKIFCLKFCLRKKNYNLKMSIPYLTYCLRHTVLPPPPLALSFKTIT